MPFTNYDQWKTASPYDDDIDWAEYGAKCTKCGTDQFEVVGSDADAMELDLECNDCSNKWVFQIPACLDNNIDNCGWCNDPGCNTACHGNIEPLDDSKVYFREFTHPSEIE